MTIASIDSMTIDSMTSMTSSMNRLDTNQALSSTIIHEPFFTLLLSYQVPHAIYYSYQVLSIHTSLGSFDIFYNHLLQTHLVRAINDYWYYVGDKSTTIYDILSLFAFPSHFPLAPK